MKLTIFFQEFLARLPKRKNSQTSLFLKIQRVLTVRSTFITLRSRLIGWQNWMNSIHFLGNKPSRMPWRSVSGGEGKEMDVHVDNAELLRQIKFVGILLVGQTLVTFIIKSLKTWFVRLSMGTSDKMKTKVATNLILEIKATIALPFL